MIVICTFYEQNEQSPSETKKKEMCKSANELLLNGKMTEDAIHIEKLTITNKKKTLNKRGAFNILFCYLFTVSHPLSMYFFFVFCFCHLCVASLQWVPGYFWFTFSS